ncbi:hypothetical protein ACHWQZ_G003214 [Mnemiopsis leidyi]
MRVDPKPSKSCEHGFIFLFWQGLGVLGGVVMFLWVDDDIDSWYKKLKTDNWFPVVDFFLPAHIIGATFAGAAAYGVWRYGGFQKQIVRLTVHLFQTVLAICWVPIIFKARDLLVGFVITFLILAMSVVRTALYFNLNAALGGLCLPSDIWYGYLSAVVLQLWNLNSE